MIKKDTTIKKIHVRKGDLVLVISGKDRGMKGKVLAVSPKEEKIMVSGAYVVSKHVKPKRQGDQSGIVKTESAFYSCKVQLVCPHCDKPTRISHKLSEGKKYRVCKKCGVNI